MDLKEMGWKGVECIDLARGQEWTHVAHDRDKWQCIDLVRDRNGLMWLTTGISGSL